MGALQEQAHVNLTAVNIAHTMERNKRNSIASFPLRPERASEDRDGAAGFGLGELGVNGPSQVSGVMRLPRLERCALQRLALTMPSRWLCVGRINDSGCKKKSQCAWSLFGF